MRKLGNGRIGCLYDFCINVMMYLDLSSITFIGLAKKRSVFNQFFSTGFSRKCTKVKESLHPDRM